MLTIVVLLISGAIGGNLMATLLSNYSMGSLWNSVVGIIGGIALWQLLASIILPGIDPDTIVPSGDQISKLICATASGALGGAILLLIVGFTRRLSQ